MGGQKEKKTPHHEQAIEALNKHPRHPKSPWVFGLVCFLTSPGHRLPRPGSASLLFAFFKKKKKKFLKSLKLHLLSHGYAVASGAVPCFKLAGLGVGNDENTIISPSGKLVGRIEDLPRHSSRFTLLEVGWPSLLS